MNKLKNDGFTLIEIIIAITILSLLMAYIYSMIDSSSRVKHDVTIEDREFLSVETFFSRFEQDVSQLYTPLYFQALKKTLAQRRSDGDESKKTTHRKYKTSERFPFSTLGGLPVPLLMQENKSQFIFMSSANRRFIENIKQSRYLWVKYDLISNSDFENEQATEMITRQTISENIYDTRFDWSKEKSYPILKNVKSFSIEFWNKEQEKFVDSLRLLGKEKFTPRLIKVKLSWVNRNNNSLEFERIFRPLWPFFDTQKDEKEKNKKPKSSKKGQDENR